MHVQFPCAGLEREAQAGRRGLAFGFARAKQQHAGAARFRSDRKPAQLLVAGGAEPREQRAARPCTQHLLRRPQGISTPRCAHHGELGKVDPGGSERRRIRQMGRREPDDALARVRESRQRGQRDLQLADAFLRTEDLRQPANRPPAAGQLAVEISVTRGNGTGKSCRRRATPDQVALQ